MGGTQVAKQTEVFRAIKAILFSFLAFFSIQSADAQQASPMNFLWGAAFSAHQVEGGNDGSDWWEWEHTPGKIAGNQTTAVATDHYNRFREDFALAKKLNLNTVRLSVSWSRIEPENGKFNEKELNHYRDVILDLRRRGIEPMVTLHHFTHPVWFNKMGGWLNQDSPAIFARFSEEVAKALYPHVNLWITFNEPMIQIIDGFLKGISPPAISGMRSMVTAYRNIVRAHGMSAKVLRKHTPETAKRLPVSGVGLALNMNVFDPARDPNTQAGQNDLKAIEVLAHLSQWAIFDAVQTGHLKWRIPSVPALPGAWDETIQINEAKDSLDWIGINYYHRYLIRRESGNSLGVNWVTPKEGLIHPPGIGRLLKEASDRLKTKIPLVVSENGLADDKDKIRQKFIQEHLDSIADARKSGVDVRGYLYWSLTDNFEWSSGFGPRFGLVEIDYSTLERKIRPSAFWFADFIKQNPIGPQ